jgi:glycosyltransferase involved in cell wall biosynthesis
MIAFHYPPCRGSSGLQRTLSFSRHLLGEGWQPVVLTVKPSVHSRTSDDQLGDIPAEVQVERAFALDTQRDLGIRGRYLKWMALPDFWVSWFFWAIPLGLRLVRKYKPKIIWSTYPIATAHLLALALHRLTGIPWVADFRDPMIEINPLTGQRRPADRTSWRLWSLLERLTVQYCSRAVFTTEGALRIYAERYPHLPTDRWTIIPNGYDEEHFVAAERIASKLSSETNQILLLHSGVLYGGTDRNPTQFFAALGKLRSNGQISPSTIRVILRASGYESDYRTLIRKHRIDDMVFLEPAIPYREALAEMLSADGLLIFQGYTSNPAIPAKLYEYLRAQRPIFALVDSEGDTAKTLKATGVGTMVPMDSEDQIATGLLEFLQLVRDGKAPVMDRGTLRNYARESHARDLAQLLDEVSDRQKCPERIAPDVTG